MLESIANLNAYRKVLPFPMNCRKRFPCYLSIPVGHLLRNDVINRRGIFWVLLFHQRQWNNIGGVTIRIECTSIFSKKPMI